MINSKNTETDVELERCKRPKVEDVDNIISESETENIAEEIAKVAKRKYRLKYLLTQAKNAQIQVRKLEAIRKLKWHVFVALLVCVVGVGINTFRSQSMDVEDASRHVVSNQNKLVIPNKEDAELYGQVVNEHKGDRLKIIDSAPDKELQNPNEKKTVSPDAILQSTTKDPFSSLDIRMVPENVTIAARDTDRTSKTNLKIFKTLKNTSIDDVLEKYKLPRATILAINEALGGRGAYYNVHPGQEVHMFFADLEGTGRTEEIVRLTIEKNNSIIANVAITDRHSFIMVPVSSQSTDNKKRYSAKITSNLQNTVVSIVDKYLYENILYGDIRTGLVSNKRKCPKKEMQFDKEYLTKFNETRISSSLSAIEIETEMCNGGNKHGQYFLLLKNDTLDLHLAGVIEDMNYSGGIIKANQDEIIFDGLKWEEGDPHCCPSKNAKLRYKINEEKYEYFDISPR